MHNFKKEKENKEGINLEKSHTKIYHLPVQIKGNQDVLPLRLSKFANLKNVQN